MSEVKKLVDQINSKIYKLISAKQSLLVENNKLQNKQEELLKRIEEQNKIIEELKNKNEYLAIAKNVKQTEGNSDVNRKIEEMVREVDKCIELLNK